MFSGKEKHQNTHVFRSFWDSSPHPFNFRPRETIQPTCESCAKSTIVHHLGHLQVGFFPCKPSSYWGSPISHICFIYGIVTNIHPINGPNVGKNILKTYYTWSVWVLGNPHFRSNPKFFASRGRSSPGTRRQPPARLFGRPRSLEGLRRARPSLRMGISIIGGSPICLVQSGNSPVQMDDLD